MSRGSVNPEVSVKSRLKKWLDSDGVLVVLVSGFFLLYGLIVTAVFEHFSLWDLLTEEEYLYIWVAVMVVKFLIFLTYLAAKKREERIVL